MTGMADYNIAVAKVIVSVILLFGLMPASTDANADIVDFLNGVRQRRVARDVVANSDRNKRWDFGDTDGGNRATEFHSTTTTTTTTTTPPINPEWTKSAQTDIPTTNAQAEEPTTTVSSRAMTEFHSTTTTTTTTPPINPEWTKSAQTDIPTTNAQAEEPTTTVSSRAMTSSLGISQGFRLFACVIIMYVTVW